MMKLKSDAEFQDVDASRRLVAAETEVVIHAGSGGGWGDPLERDAARVQRDVVEELVSIEAARTHYGVVLKDDFSIDEPATLALRGKLARGRRAAAKAS